MQSLRIMGLCSLLAFSAVQANEQGFAPVGTVFKQVQGIVHGLPAGAARAAAHIFVTGPLTSAMYGANNSRLVRRIPAVIASVLLHLSVNDAIEKFRDNLTSRVEENACREKDNCELTEKTAQAFDWATYVALMVYFTLNAGNHNFPLHTVHANPFEALLRGFAASPANIDWEALAAAQAAAAAAAAQQPPAVI
jgi:hypothetical protein